MISYIAIDLQQIFYHVKRQKKRLDFKKLYDELSSDRDSCGIYTYLTTSPHTESSYLINTLKDLGFSVNKHEQKKERKQLKFSTRSVGITMDLIKNLDQYDEAVLVTIDSPLVELCDYLQSMGKKVTIYTFKKFEEEFKDYVDHVEIISEDLYVQK